MKNLENVSQDIKIGQNQKLRRKSQNMRNVKVRQKMMIGTNLNHIGRMTIIMLKHQVLELKRKQEKRTDTDHKVLRDKRVLGENGILRERELLRDRKVPLDIEVPGDRKVPTDIEVHKDHRVL